MPPHSRCLSLSTLALIRMFAREQSVPISSGVIWHQHTRNRMWVFLLFVLSSLSMVTGVSNCSIIQETSTLTSVTDLTLYHTDVFKLMRWTRRKGRRTGFSTITAKDKHLFYPVVMPTVTMQILPNSSEPQQGFKHIIRIYCLLISDTVAMHHCSLAGKHSCSFTSGNNLLAKCLASSINYSTKIKMWKTQKPLRSLVSLNGAVKTHKRGFRRLKCAHYGTCPYEKSLN